MCPIAPREVVCLSFPEYEARERSRIDWSCKDHDPCTCSELLRCIEPCHQTRALVWRTGQWDQASSALERQHLPCPSLRELCEHGNSGSKRARREPFPAACARAPCPIRSVLETDKNKVAPDRSWFTEMHFLLAARPHNSISLNMKPHADQHRALPVNVWWMAFFWRASTKYPATQDVPRPPCGAHLNCPFSTLHGKPNFWTEGATSANMLQSCFFQTLRSRPRYPAALKKDTTRATFSAVTGKGSWYAFRHNRVQSRERLSLASLFLGAYFQASYVARGDATFPRIEAMMDA